MGIKRAGGGGCIFLKKGGMKKERGVWYSFLHYEDSLSGFLGKSDFLFSGVLVSTQENNLPTWDE